MKQTTESAEWLEAEWEEGRAGFGMMNRTLSWGGEGRALRQEMQGGCAQHTEPWGRREGLRRKCPGLQRASQGAELEVKEGPDQKALPVTPLCYEALSRGQWQSRGSCRAE